MRALATIMISIVLLTSPLGGTDLLKTKGSDYGLRGRVRQSIERTTYPASDYVGERTVTTTLEFSAEGRLLQRRVGTLTGNDYVATYTYDAAGRVLKVSSGNETESGITKFDTTYNYDANGQLISINSGSGTQPTIYDTDQAGRKRVTAHFPELPAKPNVAVGAVPWEGSDLPFPPPSGGTVTSIYDEQNRPVEALVHDANGNLTMRLVRTYDKQGNIEGDKLIPEKTQIQVPEELAGQLNDAQRKAMAAFIARAFYTGESSYKYDAEGRTVEKHVTGGVRGDTLTTIRYNDHGDISEEITLETPRADLAGEFRIDEAGNPSPVSNSKAPERTRTETHYSYEYDAQGNWSKKTTTSASGAGEPITSAIVERTLTYYPDR